MDVVWVRPQTSAGYGARPNITRTPGALNFNARLEKQTSTFPFPKTYSLCRNFAFSQKLLIAPLGFGICRVVLEQRFYI